MTELYMLDTDIARYAIKGRSPGIEARLLDIHPDCATISAMTRAELLYGLKCLPMEHSLHAVVHRFLKIIRILPWGSDAADRYAEIRHRLSSGGNPMGEIDMMIAPHALSIDATLVTNNTRHYTHIGASLKLENWT